MSPRRCTKQRFRSKGKALYVARLIALPVVYVRAYRCSQCTFPDGQRAWHWTNWRATKRYR